MLGLNNSVRRISFEMLSASSSIPGFEITRSLGIVSGVAEGSFPILTLEHVSLQKGGGLDELVETVRVKLSEVAAMRGADAVIDLRFEIMGRQTEKNVLAYGTAVICRRSASKAE